MGRHQKEERTKDDKTLQALRLRKLNKTGEQHKETAAIDEQRKGDIQK